MDRQAAFAEGNPGAEDWMLQSKALALAAPGRVQLASTMSRRAVHAQDAGHVERAGVLPDRSGNIMFGSTAAA